MHVPPTDATTSDLIRMRGAHKLRLVYTYTRVRCNIKNFPSHAPRARPPIYKSLGAAALPRNQLHVTCTMDSKREKYIAATKELAETLAKTVENAKKRFSQMPTVGSSPHSAVMVAKGMRGAAESIWTAYWKWMSSIGAATRQEVDELQKSFGDDKDVLKCTEELHAAEAGFRGVAAQINTALQKEEDKVLN